MKDNTDKDKITLNHIESKEMLADILIKNKNRKDGVNFANKVFIFFFFFFFFFLE